MILRFIYLSQHALGLAGLRELIRCRRRRPQPPAAAAAVRTILFQF
jgi:hypothetical protein